MRDLPLFRVLDTAGSMLAVGDLVVGVEVKQGHVDVLLAAGEYAECHDLFWNETWGMSRRHLEPLNQAAEDMLAAADEEYEHAKWMRNAN